MWPQLLVFFFYVGFSFSFTALFFAFLINSDTLYDFLNWVCFLLYRYSKQYWRRDREFAHSLHWHFVSTNFWCILQILQLWKRKKKQFLSKKTKNECISTQMSIYLFGYMLHLRAVNLKPGTKNCKVWKLVILHSNLHKCFEWMNLR